MTDIQLAQFLADKEAPPMRYALYLDRKLNRKTTEAGLVNMIGEAYRARARGLLAVVVDLQAPIGPRPTRPKRAI